jgi:release factor glutamine methyltransferase
VAVPTAKHVVRDAVKVLRASDAIEHPHAGKERVDAAELLEFVLGAPPEEDAEVPPEALRRFNRLLARRAAGEPPAYLTGTTTFRDLTLEVGRGAFIPRESSEFMATQAIRRLHGRRRPVHVDLATGVGPVALAVASSVRRARVFGIDLYARPVILARRNAERLRLHNVTFLRGDLFRPLPRGLQGGIDVVTIHPPYVGRQEVRELPHEIVRFEPIESLTDRSPLGLGLLSRVAIEAPRWLRTGGWLLVEVSPDRSKAVATVLRRAGFHDIRSTKGPVPVSRVVVGRT